MNATDLAYTSAYELASLIRQKRLSAGRFKWWPQSGQEATCGLDPHELHLLLWNGNPMEVKTAPMWRRMVPAL